MPLVNKTFNQLIDFTRTSSATYVDSAGKIVPTAASRNLLTFTQEFDNAAWTKNNAAVTANTATAPDGTLTADVLVEDTSTNVHNAQQSATLTAATHTFSIYLKARERTWAQVLNGTIANGFAYFNLATGVVGTVGAGVTATSITSVGNGWYRCSITFTAASGGNILAVRPASANGTASYTGDGTSGVFIWGAQLEAGSTLTDYTRNNGGVFPPRFDYDPVTLAPRGLLVEEQRTNLVTYSEQFDNAAWTKSGASVSANVTAAPDGTTTADKLIEDSANTSHHVRFPYSASNLTLTVSIYAKAAERSNILIQLSDNATGAATCNFNLANGTAGTASNGGDFTGTTAAIQSVGNGWYRCLVTTTKGSANTVAWPYFFVMNSGSSTATYQGDGTSGILIWGAQLEAGAFATSYIPTVASQVTRTADVATITGANFSQWYNQSEGTFVAGFSQLYSQQLVGTQGGIVRADDGTNSNQISIVKQSNTNQIWASVETRGAGGLSGNIGPHNANETKTAALAYKSGDSAGVLSGGTPLTSASANVPTALDRLRIGSSSISAGAWMLNGHIRSIRYYPTRLSNAQLQALTA